MQVCLSKLRAHVWRHQLLVLEYFLRNGFVFRCALFSFVLLSLSPVFSKETGTLSHVYYNSGFINNESLE